MQKKFKWSPGRIIVIGFAAVILVGAFLLYMPISRNPGVHVSFVDALFTSTSAVCVTGLIAVDTADHFNVFGRTVVALLIQVGGLGVTSAGAAFILLTGKKIGLKERVLLKEGMNADTLQGVVKLVKSVLFMTLFFEGIGLILSFMVFVKDYPPLSALGISAFHSVAAFNNSGFDILGGLQNLIPYRDNVLLNLTTCFLIIFGGLGFYVIKEIVDKKSFKNLSMHSKIVLTMTGALLLVGTVLLKGTEDITWLGAFFHSTSARTAGFSTYPLGTFSNAGLFVLIILMFIGASPGSTGGGIKTTTAFTIFKSVYSLSTNKSCTAFRRKIPNESIIKAFVITALAMVLVCIITFFISIIEPNLTFIQVLFEVVSGFGTVGLSTGITPGLHDLSKLLLVLTMFFGRLGPLTMASIWVYKNSTGVSYAEERITIG
ncbi:TrkH family potassium uptake protein [Alloiococcus sp. CFN-8]|uniref:TrkH family potassium uptake protein n=1 Tax=Alloiococcus sp. CFN-8 TaxID=3416081 RepID=UPI003CF88CE7